MLRCWGGRLPAVNAELDRAFGRRKFDGIRQKIEKNLLPCDAVNADIAAAHAALVYEEVYALCLRKRADRRGNVVEQVL